MNGVMSLWAIGLLISDLRWRRLPNLWLALGFAFGGGAFVVTGSMPFGIGLLEAALAFGLALACFVPFFLAGWMGAGDVKFLAVIGWLGGFDVLFFVLLTGSLLAGGMVVMQRLLPAKARCLLTSDRLPPLLQARVPYGACLALALLYRLWSGPGFVPVIWPGGG